MKLFRRKRLLAPLGYDSENRRTWKCIERTLEEDAVGPIEKEYWDQWRREATRWCPPGGETLDDEARQNVDYWEQVCGGLGYKLQNVDEPKTRALVLRIFDLDGKYKPSRLTTT